MSQNPQSPDDTRGQSLPIGTQLEEFIIERVLGSGGFGITYLARDKRLGRQVVVKENLPAQFCWRDPHSLTVRPRHSEGEDADNYQYSLDSFEREAATLASLDHPGIVRVLRSFEAYGTAYFVMPFVEGTALDEQIRARQESGHDFTEDELSGMLWRVLDALAYLHDRGIYHRDIKPGNILVTAAGEPMLIDFGAARQRLSERSLTVIESAGYTPFEQLQTRGKVGPWSDLYALGGTLYKAITGETPAKAADRIMDDPVVPLAHRAALVEHFSTRMLESIDKAMATKAADRFQSSCEWRAQALAPLDPPVHQPKEPVQDAQSAQLPPRPSPPPPPVGLASISHVPASRHVKAPLKEWLKRRQKLIEMWLLFLVPAVFLGALYLAGVFGGPQPDAEEGSATAPQQEAPAREKTEKVTTDVFEETTRTNSFTNFLGMKFVPAGTPDVLFSVWETRVRDFETYVQEIGHDTASDNDFSIPAYTLEQAKDGKGVDWKQAGGSWKDPHFPSQQTSECPVVCVSHLNAEGFCSWLTSKDRASGKIPSTATYRLPSDAEWSQACGSSEFPWGDSYPPQPGDGNYCGSEAMVGVYLGFATGLSKLGFHDEAARTADVGSGKANSFGLHDLGGNVGEWCSTRYTADLNDDLTKALFPNLKNDGNGNLYRVVRGGSWISSERVNMRSAYRQSEPPNHRYSTIGFRCVLAKAP